MQMNMKRMRLFTWALLGFFLVAAVAPSRKAQVIQAGEVVLEFNGGTVAMSQVLFATPFTATPILLCAANNQMDAGVRVACQGLTAEFGAVSAEVDEPRPYSLTVNWIAMEPTQ
jgi:hypothetical protein